MSLKTELKNPTFWAVISFILGLIIAAWGWDKNESTIEARTHGAVIMIVIGCVLAVAGLLGMWAVSNRKS
jgi:hypothetical protein